jgi:glutaredoxin-like YruB-family protein
MNIKTIKSFDELNSSLTTEKSKTYVLLYKKGSEQSDKAYEEVTKASDGIADEIKILSADLNLTRDIHPRYDIKTAPTLIEFEGKDFKNLYKGANNSSYYKALFKDAVYIAKSNKEDKVQKRVTVYSTPTCSWCNTLKSYLKQHHIRFTDVDVSKDTARAQEMVRKSGQQGVPQTDINGQVIVGFDKTRINSLLGIKEHVN